MNSIPKVHIPNVITIQTTRYAYRIILALDILLVLLVAAIGLFTSIGDEDLGLTAKY